MIVNLVLLGRLSHLLLSDSIIQLVYIDVVRQSMNHIDIVTRP